MAAGNASDDRADRLRRVGSWGSAGRELGDVTDRYLRLTTAFGLAVNPGTTLPYRHVDQNDYMPGDPRDPRTYNVFQSSASSVRTWRTGTATAERFGAYPIQYRFGVMIDLNRPAESSVNWSATHQDLVTSRPVNVRLGYSIYLHVSGGCNCQLRLTGVGLRGALLRWLTPALRPKIAMAPLWAIGRA